MKQTIASLALLACLSAQAQSVTAYRSWVNDDLATLTTSAVGPSPDAVLALTLDLPALSRTYNTITVQFKDSNEEWSVPLTTWFSKQTGPVTGYAYWIDDAITNSTTGSIGQSTVVDLIADLPTGVPAGTHTFTIRFSGANGTWSVPLITAFSNTVSIDELPGVTDVILFPNPVTEHLGLRLHSNAPRDLHLHVLDQTGAVVSDLSTWNVQGTMHQQWDLSALASGTYLLRVIGEGGTWTKPFVKP